MAERPVVTVTGTVYQEDHTTLYTGPIYFIRSVLLRHTDGTALLPMGIPIRYDVVNGVVSVQLLYVDQPGWSPQGWTWEVRVPRGSIYKSYAIAPSVDDPDSVNLGDLLAMDYVPNPGNEYSPVDHQHPTYVTDAELASALDAARNLTVGEMVIPRAQASDIVPMTSGKLYLTHFKALKTETILTAHTDCASAAVGAEHAWIGFMKWTGTQYNLDSVSVDDPTRWASAGAHYPTQVFQTDDAHFGAADLTRPGFHKVAGLNYVEFRLWVGSGAAPATWGSFQVAADAGQAPRQNMTMDLVAPPSSSLEAGWVVGSDRQHQTRMMP